MTAVVGSLRAEFPVLDTLSRGRPMVYLDSAATAQKPRAVIDAMTRFYSHDYGTIHRGVYEVSERATIAWDAARARVAGFIGAKSVDEVVFVRGTTEAINLVAQSFLKPRIAPGATVLVTEMEHHANIVPWQLAGARTVAIPISDAGELDLQAAERLLAAGCSLLAVCHVSNALGTINPIAELCRMAKQHGVPVLVDGAQAAPHLLVDVQALGCDFYCFSGHKVYGPTGIGALWGKAEHLNAMPPYQGGGDMIDLVSFERTTFAKAPNKFEAGTPHIAGALGLGAALEWLESLDREALHHDEMELLAYGNGLLGEIPGLRLVGTAKEKTGILTFTIDGVHPHDIASMLDGDGVCIRAGHHCTQPLHRRLNLLATARASLALYSTRSDLETLAHGLIKIQRMFN
jgi:cysteine desulfurase/selenocysteine lyase